MGIVAILIGLLIAATITQVADILDPLASIVLLALVASWVGKKLWKGYVSNPWHHY